MKRQKAEKKKAETQKLAGSMNKFFVQKRTEDEESSKESSDDESNDEDDPNDSYIASDKTITASSPEYESDPALWVSTTDLCSHFLKNPPSQNVSADFEMSKRMYKKKTRFCQKKYFFKKLANGERVERDWLVYSVSTGTVFCYICKMFNDKTDFGKNGFNDWKNAQARIKYHETCDEHQHSLKAACDHLRTKKIESSFCQTVKQNENYWVEVLKRIVKVIQFLAERGQAFRGHVELFGRTDNGMYLGTLELLAEFDPFLAEHIKKYGNPGKGNTSYLSSTICEEFIQILANKVLGRIVAEIKEAKYYSVSIDSTPDVAHMDQLSMIIRYANECGNPIERFLSFIVIEKHDGQYLYETMMTYLANQGIEPLDCRGQTYDNASNMSGIYGGVQALFREKNEHADWVPCAGHTLNLIGSSAVESCAEATRFFDIVQKLYTFLSGSPHRWSKLMDNLPVGGLVVKKLSETRWSARADAVKALKSNYNHIRNAVNEIATSEFTPPLIKAEASGIVHKLDSLETALMCCIWYDLLTQLNRVNSALQEPGLEVGQVLKSYNVLEEYFSTLRKDGEIFDQYEAAAKDMLPNHDTDYADKTKRQKKIKFFHDDVRAGGTSLTGAENFRINTFIPIIDKLTLEIKKRRQSYEGIYDKFGFLSEYGSYTQSQINEKCTKLVNAYKKDLQIDFVDEFRLFCKYDDFKSGQQMMDYLHSNQHLRSSFKNVEIALRIYLCIFSTSCEAERSFSTLKRVKNYQRSKMCQERLTALALLSIESEVMKELPIMDITKTFASEKARKVDFFALKNIENENYEK